MCLVTQSCPTLATPCTVPHQASLSVEFSGQEYLSILPFPSPRDLPDPGIKLVSSALRTVSLQSEPLENPQTVLLRIYVLF